jgi:hypothetical protein
VVPITPEMSVAPKLAWVLWRTVQETS